MQGLEFSWLVGQLWIRGNIDAIWGWKEEEELSECCEFTSYILHQILTQVSDMYPVADLSVGVHEFFHIFHVSRLH